MNKTIKIILLIILVIISFLYIKNSSTKLKKEVYRIEINYDSINKSPFFNTEIDVIILISNPSFFSRDFTNDFENAQLIFNKDTIYLKKISQECIISGNSNFYINLKGVYANNKYSYYSDSLELSIKRGVIYNKDRREVLQNNTAYIISSEKIHKFMDSRIYLSE